MALGNFPAHIIPWVYSYPAASILTYHKAKAMAESEETADNILYLCQSFRAAGCRRMHLMVPPPPHTPECITSGLHLSVF